MSKGHIAIFTLLAILLTSTSLILMITQSPNEDYLDQTVVVLSPDSYGTGWWVDKQHVVTAYHVVDTGVQGVVRGDWSSSAKVIYFNTTLDIAILEVSNPPPWARGLSLNYNIKQGDVVRVVGYPVQLYEELQGDIKTMSISPRVATGTIAWINPEFPVAELDVSTDAGNSGGPVVNAETGAVVGMIIYARKGIVSEGYYMLRADAIAEALKEAGLGYRVRYDLRPYLVGVSIALQLAMIVAMIAYAGRGRVGAAA